MSHVKTTPRAGRADFDALPQSHTSNGDLGDYENRYGNDDHIRRQDDGERTYSQGRASQSDETLVEYNNGRSWSRIKSDYTQVSTSYKPDMITYAEDLTEIAPVIDQERPNYKPSALRWPFLTFLLAVILTLIGLIAWALHVLPVQDSKMDIFPEGLRARGVAAYIAPAGVSDVDYAPLVVRANDTTTSIDSILDDPSITAPPPTETTSRATTSITIASSKAQEDFGNVGHKTISESVPPPSLPALPKSDYGNVGTTKVTESLEPDATETVAATSDYGLVGTRTVTETPGPQESAPSSDYGNAGSVSVSETAPPQTPTFVAPVVTVITNSEGITTTSTSTPPPVSATQKTTLTDSQGQATATQETTILVTPTVATKTDSQGVPTSTVTLYPVIPPRPEGSDSDENSDGSKGNVVTNTYFISYGEYVIGMFLPTFLAIVLAIPIRILDLNAKILQPWHELTHDRGASGADSLCLDTSGPQSIVASFRSLAGGQALVFLTTVLVLASALLIPLSAEAVAFDLRGIGCVEGSGSAQNCAYVLSVFNQGAKATLAVLAVMGLAVFMILVILVRWQSGVSTNPWSMCGVASLAMNADVRRLFTVGLAAGIDVAKMPAGLLRSVLRDRWFKLGYFYGSNGTVEYGIMLHDNHGGEYGSGRVDSGVKEEPQEHHAAPTKPSHHLPFLMLGYAGRSVLLFVLCGLLMLILYYNNTGGDTPFENFMDSESFGVRFLFTGVGVVISFFWASFFSSIAILSPYQLLAKSPQHARRSILLAPPTNAFSGLWSSARRRHGFLAVVALTSILSEFLTIFLGNIPFRITQTFLVHNICTWAAVGILCIMIIVVVWSFFIKWPHMPVDPSTVAGAMYYVCDSWMLTHFEGLSTMSRKDRDWRINEMQLKYEFGEIRGASGRVRVGVDASASSGSAHWAL